MPAARKAGIATRGRIEAAINVFDSYARLRNAQAATNKTGIEMTAASATIAKKNQPACDRNASRSQMRWGVVTSRAILGSIAYCSNPRITTPAVVAATSALTYRRN
jgi:hypothetical protein